MAAAMMATVGFAQSSMLATLSHEGEIGTYYGARALVEAYNAADNGDVITLSSGSFVATNIEKGITIRGAGMAIDSQAQNEPTVITGDFIINIPDETTTRLTLEGIYHNHLITINGNFKNGTFIKDRFRQITSGWGDETISNLSMINCYVSKELDCPQNSSISCVNCVVVYPYCYDSETSIFEFSNCIIIGENMGYNIYSASYKNCILAGNTQSGNYLYSSCTAYNCINVDAIDANMFKNIPNSTNSEAEYASVFKTFTGTYSDSELFELTDEAKATYLGLDGKEVGIYGGMMPYSSVPTNPQITKCNVASKSTPDGKLSVDITIGSSDSE